MKKKEFSLPGAEGRPFAVDLRYDPNKENQPIIVFLHGFKGFKDWGHFNLLADAFADKGFAYLKFNFSHNGTSVENPTNFIDLDAFGHNTFEKELSDLQTVLSYIEDSNQLPENIDRNRVYLLAHSRGGAIAIITAAHDNRVKKVATLSSISDLEKRFSEKQFSDFEDKGLTEIPNSRTNQIMPLHRDLIDEYRKKNEKLNILKNASELKVPQLIIHAGSDETVGVDEAKDIQKANPQAKLEIIERASHVYGGKHPWDKETLPEHSQRVVELASVFFGE